MSYCIQSLGFPSQELPSMSFLESEAFVDLHLNRQVFLLSQPVVEELQHLRHVLLAEHLHISESLVLPEQGQRLQQELITKVYDPADRLFF